MPKSFHPTAKRLRLAAARLRRVIEGRTDCEDLTPALAASLATSAKRLDGYADAFECVAANDAPGDSLY